MQGASRLSLAAAREQLDRQLGSSAGSGLDFSRISDELFSVAMLLDREFALRRVLSDPSTASDARVQLAESVLGHQVSAPTMTVVRDVVTARWSRPPDLTDALEQLGRQVVFVEAERAGVLDEVEDELFRFGRILDREPALAKALTDTAAPPQDRARLLDTLVSGKVHGETRRLLDHVVEQPRGRSLDHVIDDLSDQAAAHRQRSIATVRSPVPLTPDQESRLIASLRRIYGRDVVLQTEVDRDLLGGLVVQIDDDIIDGSVTSRLDAAARKLTR